MEFFFCLQVRGFSFVWQRDLWYVVQMSVLFEKNTKTIKDASTNIEVV